jgi:dihydroorotate dehydrogenase (fumarate)
MVSALLHHGPSYVTVMRHALEEWLDWHGMASVDEARGRLSLQTTQDPAAYERANYIRTLQSWGR